MCHVTVSIFHFRFVPWKFSSWQLVHSHIFKSDFHVPNLAMDAFKSCWCDQHNRWRVQLSGWCIQRSCCAAETVASARVINEAYGAEYHWDRCGPLSDACEQFFVMEACFYECEPNAGLWRKYNDSEVRGCAQHTLITHRWLTSPWPRPLPRPNNHAHVTSSRVCSLVRCYRLHYLEARSLKVGICRIMQILGITASDAVILTMQSAPGVVLYDELNRPYLVQMSIRIRLAHCKETNKLGTMWNLHCSDCIWFTLFCAQFLLTE